MSDLPREDLGSAFSYYAGNAKSTAHERWEQIQILEKEAQPFQTNSRNICTPSRNEKVLKTYHSQIPTCDQYGCVGAIFLKLCRLLYDHAWLVSNSEDTTSFEMHHIMMVSEFDRS